MKLQTAISNNSVHSTKMTKDELLVKDPLTKIPPNTTICFTGRYKETESRFHFLSLDYNAIAYYTITFIVCLD